jgi:hypothetical protein
MKPRTLNSIMFGLFVLLIGIAGWLFYSAQNKKTTSKSTTPNVKITQAAKDYAATAPILSAKSIEIRKAITNTDKVLGDLVLEKNSNFTVFYLIHNDEFFVNINKTPFASGKTKAEDWFKAKGFSASDLCLIRISFLATKEVKQPLSESEIIPTGCTF